MADTITKFISSRESSGYKRQPFNEYQEFLYNRALFGLTVYSKEEVQMMHYDKKKRIIKVHKRAQTLLNLWKQKIIITLSNYFFSTIFPDTPITKDLTGPFNVTEELHVSKMSLKSLHITRVQVVERFIEEGILPKNFNNLTPKDNECRISSKRDTVPNTKPRKHTGGRAVKSTVQTGQHFTTSA